MRRKWGEKYVGPVRVLAVGIGQGRGRRGGGCARLRGQAGEGRSVWRGLGMGREGQRWVGVRGRRDRVSCGAAEREGCR